MARKILLADDSVTAQNMGRKILADAGYEVITVNNGSAALKKIAEQKPDLIVLDVYMPGYSGLEVCQRLKEVKETARIPVLLTVGKLEPFKPEECKRVRAEGYIVKPFEASELLSALSKLEDRVVPRAESSKPGRFARAIAAVEEGRTDEAADGNDADDGWKNRIVFPSKKKKKQKEKEDEGEEETYNPVNRDMRTIVDRPTSREIAPKAEDSRLDVAALAAAAGLPKDVTPEELAALAAAAAQVQAAVDGKESLAASAEPTVVAPPVEEKAETHSEARAGATFAQQSELVRDFDVIAAPAVLNVDEVNAQGQLGGGNGTGRSEHETEKAELNKSAIEERAIDKRETEEKGAAPDEAAVPATMAVAASVPFAAVSSTHRWTAVPVGIAAEEASISLEQEMQKAYAAFATAEANQPGFMAKAPDGAAPASLGPDEEEIARTLRDVAHASADAVGSALQQLEAVAETQISAVPDAATREQEAREQEARAEEARQQEAREREAREQAAREQEAREQEARAEEIRQQEMREREAREHAAREQEAREQEARAEEARQQEMREREAREQAAREQEAREQEARAEEARQQEAREREAREQAVREQESREQEARAEEARQQEAREREAREQAAREQEAKEQEAKEQEARQREVAAAEAIIAEAVSAAAQARATESPAVRMPGKGKEKVSGGDMAEKENEIAATTAAAWASWRQIRESSDKSKPTGGSKTNRQEDDDEDYPEPAPDKAAMAVAAGAEKSSGSEAAPEASTDDPEAIASIVDKVLADLRPKIAEEISRKLKKK